MMVEPVQRTLLSNFTDTEIALVVVNERVRTLDWALGSADDALNPFIMDEDETPAPGSIQDLLDMMHNDLERLKECIRVEERRWVYNKTLEPPVFER